MDSVQRLLFLVSSLSALTISAAYDVCQSEPCQNGGTCIVPFNENDVFLCICPPRYLGRRCELDITKTDLSTTPTVPSQDSDTDLDNASGITSRHFAWTIISGILGFIFLGIVCFLFKEKFQGSHTCQDDAEITALTGSRRHPDDARRSRAILDQPEARMGHYNMAITGEEDLPPPYSSLEFPPSYSSIVKDTVVGEQGRGGEGRIAVIGSPASSGIGTDPPPQFPNAEPNAQPPNAEPNAQLPNAEPNAQLPIAEPNTQSPVTEPNAQPPVTEPTTHPPVTQSNTHPTVVEPTEQFPATESTAQPSVAEATGRVIPRNHQVP